MKRVGEDALLSKLAEIDVADRARCLEFWRLAIGRPPPKFLSTRFMKRVLIHDAQCRALGDVSIKTDRALRQIAEGKQAPTLAKPGSHLVREWNGRTYQIEVTEEGFVMDGQTYRSLSALAYRITGARWSGPRFFGMT